MALGVGKIAQRMGGKRGPADRRFGGMGGGDACRRTPVRTPGFLHDRSRRRRPAERRRPKPPQPTLAPARPRGCYVIKTRESGPGVSSIPLLGRSFFAGDDYEIAAAGAHWGSATGKVAADGVVATSFPVNPSGIDGLAPTRVQLTMN
jgi:hypothetical protein